MTNFKTFLTTILIATSMNACAEVIEDFDETQNIPTFEVDNTDTIEDVIEEVVEDIYEDIVEDIIEDTVEDTQTDTDEDTIEDTQTDTDEDTSALEPVIEEPEETCQYAREDGTVVLTTDIDKCMKINIDFCKTLLNGTETECEATSYKVERDLVQMTLQWYCSNGAAERFTCDFLKRDLTHCSTSTYSDLPLCDNAEHITE